MLPKLSILIPTRNRRAYVSHAIRSALDIPSDAIEVIVSENHSEDDTWDLVNSFYDARLKVVRPSTPLPMHENWEFLLQNATGTWVTFIGDDDAILPYALDELEKYANTHPWCEAIYSARGYFFWPSDQSQGGLLRFSYLNVHEIVDSKTSLHSLLNGTLNYLFSPQVYSGGFQRKSLISRVKNSRGRYFMSAIPDASSAVNSLSFTSRFLRVGIPLCLVGTSPDLDKTNSFKNIKSRSQDFHDRLHVSDITLHPLFPVFKEPKTFFPVAAHFSFLEAFCSSLPFCNSSLLESAHFDRILMRTLIEIRAKNLNNLEKELMTYYGNRSVDEGELASYQALFPETFPDPIPGSVTYSSEGISVADIGEAVDLVKHVYLQG